jgi:hypothetical protein
MDMDKDISSFVYLLQGAWFKKQRYKSNEGDENGIMRTRAFLAAVRAAQEERLSEFLDYLRPVLNRIRLSVDSDGKPDVKPIVLQGNPQVDDVYPAELQWAYAAFKCFEKIRWKELKYCTRCGRPFYGGGSKKIYCTPRCMTKVNNYKPERDREKARVRNFILRLQKRAVQIEPLLDEYLKKRNLKMSCVSDKWQKAMRKWERKKLLESDGVEPKKEEYTCPNHHVSIRG